MTFLLPSASLDLKVPNIRVAVSAPGCWKPESFFGHTSPNLWQYQIAVCVSRVRILNVNRQRKHSSYVIGERLLRALKTKIFRKYSSLLSNGKIFSSLNRDLEGVSHFLSRIIVVFNRCISPTIRCVTLQRRRDSLRAKWLTVLELVVVMCNI